MNEVGTFKRISNTEPLSKHNELFRTPKLSDLPLSVVLFLVSRAGILGMFPFPVAMFAAIYDKKITYLGMIFVSIGLLSMGSGPYVIKYIFAMLIFLLFSRIKEDYENNQILSSAVCGLSIFIGGLSYAIYPSIIPYQIFLLIAESILTAFLYIVFDKSSTIFLIKMKRNKISQEEVICFCLTMGIIISGFSGFVLPFGISVQKLLSVYAVMILALHTSLATAGSGGLATGLICGMDNPNIIGLMGTYGLCALIGNLLKQFGKYGVVIGFLAGCSIVMLYEGSSLLLPIKISEVVGASLFFLLTPKAIQRKMGAFFSKTYHSTILNTDIRIKEYLTMRLEATAKAFSKLSDSFKEITEKQLNTASEDVAELFDETAERICRKCSMSSHCWQRGFNDTYKSMFQLLSVLESKGTLTLADAPLEFCEKCIRGDELINTFNHVYELYKQNTVWTGEVSQSRNLLATQYEEVSHIMKQFSGEIANGFEFITEMEDKIIEELDKNRISCNEVSVIESGLGKIEVYISLKNSTDQQLACEIISTLLDTPLTIDTSFDGSIFRLISKSNMEVDLGTCQLSKSEQGQNGDSLAYFHTDDHKFIIALSDGMGSGKRAMEQSQMTTQLLTEFLRAGFGKGTSINMINSSLALKSAQEMFSTIDLLSIDLTTGVAEFLKAGATESYICHEDEIETVFCMSLPAGMLDNADVETEKRYLFSGDIVVMLSDGITDVGKSLVRGEWIKRIMLGKHQSAQDLADEILSGAVKRSHSSPSDDMSVIVLKLK